MKTDPKCAELQQCLLACPVPGSGKDGGAGDGGGGDGGVKEGGAGDGGGAGDAGKDGGGNGSGAKKCEEDCNAKFPTQQTAQKAYNDCITGLCGTVCK